LQSVDNFQDKFKQMILALTTNGDIVTCSKELAYWTDILLNDTKGASLLINDPSITLQLTQGSRSSAQIVDSLLESAMNLAGVEDINEKLPTINEEFNKLSRQLAVVKQSITAAENSLEDTHEIDLEDLAERELLNAARIIEEAAAALLSQNADRQYLLTEGELNVEAAIMKAALAITQSTQLLMTAAAEAQQERVAKGRHSRKDPSSRYHTDPMWAEGLISAARAVAQSTRELVFSANDATQGKIDDSYLIASSKSVSATTTQLVTATRVKSDANSKSQAKLDNAAKSVMRATKALVDVAKNYATKEEQEMITRGTSHHGNFRFEMEQNGKIEKLGRELEETRKILIDKRKLKYKKDPTELVNPFN